MEAMKQTRKNLAKKLTQQFDEANIQTFATEKNYLDIEKKLQTPEAKVFLENLMTPLLDDLNTPAMLAVINKNTSTLNPEMMAIIYRLETQFLKVGLFDISLCKTKEVDVPQEVCDLAEQRRQAKKSQDYKLADEFRDKIHTLGFQVKDDGESYCIEKG